MGILQANYGQQQKTEVTPISVIVTNLNGTNFREIKYPRNVDFSDIPSKSA